MGYTGHFSSQVSQDAVMEELHLGHPGVPHMKVITRRYLRWPGLNKDLKKLARACNSCQAVKHAPAAAPLNPWVWPSRPWQCVHVKFAGPFLRKCISLLLMLILNEVKYFIWDKPHLRKQSKFYVCCLRVMDYPGKLSLIMDPNLLKEFHQFMQGNEICTLNDHPASNNLGTICTYFQRGNEGRKTR